MDTAQHLQDCYFYYYSSCNKGSSCPFRHSEAALGSEVMCKFWMQGKCNQPNCQYRHMMIEKRRDQIACYWEQQPGGCQKPHCPFRHTQAAQVGAERLIHPSAPVVQAGQLTTGQAVHMSTGQAVHLTTGQALRPVPTARHILVNPAHVQQQDVDTEIPEDEDHAANGFRTVLTNNPSPQIQPVRILTTPEKRPVLSANPANVAVRSLQAIRSISQPSATRHGAGRGWVHSGLNKPGPPAPGRVSAKQRLTARRAPVKERLGQTDNSQTQSTTDTIQNNTNTTHSLKANTVNSLKTNIVNNGKTINTEKTVDKRKSSTDSCQEEPKKKRAFSPIRFDNEKRLTVTVAVTPKPSGVKLKTLSSEKDSTETAAEPKPKPSRLNNVTLTSGSVHIKTLDEILAEKRKRKQTQLTNESTEKPEVPVKRPALKRNAINSPTKQTTVTNTPAEQKSKPEEVKPEQVKDVKSNEVEHKPVEVKAPAESSNPPTTGVNGSEKSPEKSSDFVNPTQTSPTTTTTAATCSKKISERRSTSLSLDSVPDNPDLSAADLGDTDVLAEIDDLLG